MDKNIIILVNYIKRKTKTKTENKGFVTRLSKPIENSWNSPFEYSLKKLFSHV